MDSEFAKGPVDPSELAGQLLLTLDPRHHLHRETSEIAAAHGMLVSPDYEGTSLDSLHMMAASGLGLTVLPQLYLKSDVGGSTGLAVLEVMGWKAHRSVALAWRRGTSMEAAFRVIADQIQRSARLMLDQPDS